MIEKSSLKDGIRIKQADFVTTKIEQLYDFLVQNQECIQETNSLLNENPNLNLLLYYNHISFPDPVFIYWLYNKFLDSDLNRQVILPASYLHTRFTYNPGFASVFTLGKLVYGYQGIRLIQSYMVGNQYTPEEATKNYRHLVKSIKEPKKKPLTLIIAPEGHRSDDGLSLQKGDEGMVKLAKMMAPVVMLPVGISYRDRQYDRSKLNFHQSVNLNLAPPVFIETRQDSKLDFSFLMKHLAETLPEDMRGYWSQN